MRLRLIFFVLWIAAKLSGMQNITFMLSHTDEDMVDAILLTAEKATTDHLVAEHTKRYELLQAMR